MPEAKRASWLRRLGRLLALVAGNLALLLALLLALEGVTWLVGLRFPSLGPPRGDRELWVYDASLGWFHRPFATGASPRGGPDRGIVRLNGMGLRGPEITLRKPEGVKRLLVLGDSFAFGVGVDESHLLTTHLRRLLEASSGERWEVVNMAVSGYSTDQELILFEELGARLAPDVVLLVACDNDFEGNTEGFVYRWYYKPYFERTADGKLIRRNTPVPRLSRTERARLWLARHSNVWNAVRSRRPTSRLAVAIVHLFHVRPPLRSGEDPVELMAALTRAIRDHAEAAGARFGLVNTGHRGEHTPLFHALRPYLRRDGISFLGLEGELKRSRQLQPWGYWDFGDDTHWNVDAHRRVAEIVNAYLAAADLLPHRPERAADDPAPSVGEERRGEVHQGRAIHAPPSLQEGEASRGES